MTKADAEGGTPDIMPIENWLRMKAEVIKRTGTVANYDGEYHRRMNEAAETIADANRRIAELDTYNVGLADEVRIVRGKLDDLVDAIDGSADMDEMDGPEYKVSQDELEKALIAARPHTEKAITQQAIAALEGGRDVYK